MQDLQENMDVQSLLFAESVMTSEKYLLTTKIKFRQKKGVGVVNTDQFGGKEDLKNFASCALNIKIEDLKPTQVLYSTKTCVNLFYSSKLQYPISHRNNRNRKNIPARLS